MLKTTHAGSNRILYAAFHETNFSSHPHDHTNSIKHWLKHSRVQVDKYMKTLRPSARLQDGNDKSWKSGLYKRWKETQRHWSTSKTVLMFCWQKLQTKFKISWGSYSCHWGCCSLVWLWVPAASDGSGHEHCQSKAFPLRDGQSAVKRKS